MILEGTGVSGGTAVGRLVLVSRVQVDAAVMVKAVSAEEALVRLADAVDCSRKEIEELAARARIRIGASGAAIVEAQLLMLDDPEWLDPIIDDIRSGTAAEAAVWRTSKEAAEILGGLDDPYLRERAADVLDVAQRVAGHLTGHSSSAELSELAGDVIIGAYELTPTETLGLDLEVVRGIVTEAGARTSHAAILARQLGIPAVVGVARLMASAAGGDLVIVDGDRGLCTVNPDPEEAESVRIAVAAGQRRPVITESVSTADGVTVRVYANATSPDDVARAVQEGADGIGLLRTEFLFMQTDRLPDEERQFAFYDAVAAAAAGRPVTFRTLDIGGDKPVPGLQTGPEDNPFLGVRGIRLTLQHLEVFEAQLRALARTAERHPDINVMVPMVSGLEELDAVRTLLATVVPDATFRFGAMVEVPSVALMIPEVAAEVDFLSVGTNDLTSYLLAVDRGNPDLQYLYTELHPAMIRTLGRIRSDAGSTPLSICGEVAGDPRALNALLGLGYQQLSVSAPLVSSLKARIRDIDVAAMRPVVETLLHARRHRDVQDALGELSRLEGGH